MQRSAAGRSLAQEIVHEARSLQQPPKTTHAIMWACEGGILAGVAVVAKNKAGQVVLMPWPDLSRGLLATDAAIQYLEKARISSAQNAFRSNGALCLYPLTDKQQLEAWTELEEVCHEDDTHPAHDPQDWTGNFVLEASFDHRFVRLLQHDRCLMWQDITGFVPPAAALRKCLTLAEAVVPGIQL